MLTYREHVIFTDPEDAVDGAGTHFELGPGVAVAPTHAGEVASVERVVTAPE